MGIGVDFKGTNCVFAAPKGRDDVCDLRLFRNRGSLVMCWELNEAELQEVVKTHQVFLHILGHSLPPHFIGSESSVRALAMDYGGIW